MRSRRVVVLLEKKELSLKIASVPERNVIEELTADRPDQPLDERVRQGHVRHGLDGLDLQDP